MVRPYLNDISNDEGERYAVYRYYGNSKKMRRLSRERERRKVKNWSSLAKTELFGLMLTGQMGTGVLGWCGAFQTSVGLGETFFRSTGVMCIFLNRGSYGNGLIMVKGRSSKSKWRVSEFGVGQLLIGSI